MLCIVGAWDPTDNATPAGLRELQLAFQEGNGLYPPVLASDCLGRLRLPLTEGVAV